MQDVLFKTGLRMECSIRYKTRGDMHPNDQSYEFIGEVILKTDRLS